MVDMVLDHEKSRTYNCNTCDYNLQINRNCSNYYSKTNIKLNDNLYRQCPRSFIFNKREEKFLVDLYFECKDLKIYPAPGSIASQTAFTKELFDYIDELVNIYRVRKDKEHQAKINKNTSKK